jgi:hypothetical protein
MASTTGLPAHVASATATEAHSSAGGQTVYVVRGTTGEYSDRTEWSVYGFESEAEARAYVDFLGEQRKRLPQRSWSYTDDLAVEVEMRKFDPCFSEDYTGTSWYVEPVLIQSSASASVAAAERSEAGCAGKETRDAINPPPPNLEGK